MERVVFQSAFVHYTQPPPLQASWWGGHQVNSRSYLNFYSKAISTRWIASVVSTCDCNFFDRKVMYFFSRTMQVHIRLLPRNVLIVVYNNYPGQQAFHISRQLNNYGTGWGGQLLFLQSLQRPLPKKDNRYKILGTVYLRMSLDSLMTVFLREYTPPLPPEECIVCIAAIVWAPLILKCVFDLVCITCHILLQWYITCHINCQYNEGSIFTWM